MSALPGAALVATGATHETARLRLRHFEERDLEALASMYADAESMRYIGDGSTLGRAETWRSISSMLGHWLLRGYGMWAIELKSSGDFVGRVGFIDPEGWPGFELGWMISRRHQGRGYATEASRFALDHALDVLHRPRVISLIRPGNEASLRVARKLGMRREDEIDLLGGPVIVHAAPGR